MSMFGKEELGVLKIPDNAVKYILFQRTDYLRLTRTLFYRVAKRLFPFTIYNQAVAIESRLRASRVKTLYETDLKNDYCAIKEFLPKTCCNVLDIGCGVAGINVFINGHYPDRAVNFYLLDKSQVDRTVFYGFNPKGEFYNSLEIAREMLTKNGIVDSCVQLVEATDCNDIKVNSKIDLVISLISWGFHYSVGTYLDKVYDVLNEDGVAILDIRKGTDCLNEVKRKFDKVAVIMETKSFHRVLMKR